MQQLLKGPNSLQSVPALLQERQVSSLLLVTGEHFLQQPAFANLQAALPCPFRLLHPPKGLLQQGSIPVVENADAVLAIGGGKTIDFAKGLLHRSANRPFFIAAPTTAGSGSEATPFAVFYKGEEKVSVEHSSLLPAVAVLDETLLLGLPVHQRAISGADAFAQCVESVWNQHSMPASEAVALEGLSLLVENLPSFIAGDTSVAARTLYAAHLSGKAIAHTRTTGPHALSYYLTARHGVPHGQAVALFLPLFFSYNRRAAEPALQKIFSVLQVRSAEEACERCTQFFASLGLATRFAQLGFYVDVDALLASVNHQRFANNPAPFDAVELKRLITRYLC